MSKTITMVEMQERIQENTGFFPSDIRDVLREFNKQLDKVIENKERFNLGCVVVWGEEKEGKECQDPRDNTKKIYVSKHTHPMCQISDLTKKKYRYKRYIRDGKTDKVWDKYQAREKNQWDYFDLEG